MPHLDNYDPDDIDDAEIPEETFEQREANRLRAEAALDHADERAGRVGGRRRLPGALEGAPGIILMLARQRRRKDMPGAVLAEERRGTHRRSPPVAVRGGGCQSIALFSGL